MLVLFSFPISYLEKHSYPRVVKSENTLSVEERQFYDVIDIDMFKLFKPCPFIGNGKCRRLLRKSSHKDKKKTSFFSNEVRVNDHNI